MKKQRRKKEDDDETGATDEPLKNLLNEFFSQIIKNFLYFKTSSSVGFNPP